MLRNTTAGFEILGRPEGIERLGGIDFDAAVFSHVRDRLDGKLAELDEDDATAMAAVARLHEECTDAKEALSSDTETSIPVLLPQLATEVRLTRTELEAMVRPALHDTIGALRRVLRSAGVTPEQFHSVLLVGGCSRMPVVAQLVGAELGRPVAVDAHPKHAVALGAAWLASGADQTAPAKVVATATVIPPPSSLPTDQPPPSTAVREVGTGRRRVPVIVGVIAAVVLTAGAVALAAVTGDGPAVTAEPPPAGESAAPPDPVPPDEQCTDELRQNRVWVCLTSVEFDGDQLVIDYQAEWAGEIPNKSTGYHIHLYGGDGTNPPEEEMGNQAAQPGAWKIEDQQPAIMTAEEVAGYIGDAPKVCARIADGGHGLVPDAAGGYHTGNCLPIPR